MTSSASRHLIIRAAGADDLPAIEHLLDQAGEWMRGQGITDQWPIRFPLSDLTQRIHRSELYIALHSITPVGTFALDHYADPELWRDEPGADGAAYLHRLAVTRTCTGHAIGAQLIDHAARLTADSGRRWLRLDCAKRNTRLHDYYRQLGFTYLHTVDLPHRRSGALFQRDTRD